MEGRIDAKRLKTVGSPTKSSFPSSTHKRKAANAKLRQVSTSKIYIFLWYHKRSIVSHYILITSHMYQIFHLKRKHECSFNILIHLILKIISFLRMCNNWIILILLLPGKSTSNNGSSQWEMFYKKFFYKVSTLHPSLRCAINTYEEFQF